MKLLLAVGIGLAAGLLLAPRSGQETRDRLREQADEAKLRMKNATSELKRHGSESSQQVREAAASVRATGKTMKTNLTNQAKTAKEDVKRAAKKENQTEA